MDVGRWMARAATSIAPHSRRRSATPRGACRNSKFRIQNSNADRDAECLCGCVCLLHFAFCIALSGCAARRVSLPADPGTLFPDFAEAYQAATASCGGVRTLTAELGLSGSAGGRRVRGRAIVGFAQPDSMRLEGVAPFGPPAFILAARDGHGSLLLPRDRRAVRDAPPEEILDALVGIALSPAALQAVLTGCVVPVAPPVAGRLHENGWASIDLGDGATIYLQREGTGWRIRAGRRRGWQVDYPSWQGTFPGAVRLTSLDGAVDVDVTAAVSQLETNVPIDQSAFVIDIPQDAIALSLTDLREAGPLSR